jgi:prepilin-type N-terminal cleavage/methylation domain-containing protein
MTGAAGGFSLVELMVVIAMMAILMAIALPPFVSWRKTLSYRQAAWGIQDMLKEAKSLTITRNLQHMVIIEPGNGSYKLVAGSRAYNTPTTGWSASPLQSVAASANVVIRGTSAGTSTDNVYIQFNPNGTAKLAAPDGTANDGSVTVNDGAKVIFCLSVSSAGRIRMEKRN